MHLVVPHAHSASPGAAQAASALSLPHLERLVARLDADTRDEGDELSLSPPHERILAQVRGWTVTDGLLPFAAVAALADGLSPQPGAGWGLLSPTHWHLGTEQVSLTHPADLALDETTSRALFQALFPLFQDDGWALHWGAPTRWYAEHPSLATLPTASLDRVVGRNVDWWLNSHPEAKRIRRLQAEVQMLLYTHPVNEAREAANVRPVNSFWLSGTGPAPVHGALPADVLVDDRLSTPALQEDWDAWVQAWAALDAGPIRLMLSDAEAGAATRLTLCGERHAQTFVAGHRPWYRRGLLRPRALPAAPLLATL